MTQNGKTPSTRSIGALGQKRMEIKYDSNDGILVTYCCRQIISKPSCLKEQHLSYSFCGSGTNWVCFSWVLWLPISHKTAVKINTWVVASSGGTAGEGFASNLTHMVVRKIQFLVGYWPKVPLNSLLFPLSSLQLVSCFIRISKKSQRKSVSKMEVTVLCNLTSEVTCMTSVIFYPLKASP